MTPERRQELRQWSAELTEHTEGFDRGDVWIYKNKNGGWVQWQPDSPDAPASQILGVIEAMKGLGWSYSAQTGDAGRHRASFHRYLNLAQEKPDIGKYDSEFHHASAGTLPEAILLAAHAALKEKANDQP